MSVLDYPTVYSNEPILRVHGRSMNKTLALASEYEAKGWESFFPPFNVVYQNKTDVGPKRNGGCVCYMRKKA